jgi:hypothetical protein
VDSTSWSSNTNLPVRLSSFVGREREVQGFSHGSTTPGW